jgi:hypothetical protein
MLNRLRMVVYHRAENQHVLVAEAVNLIIRIITILNRCSVGTAIWLLGKVGGTRINHIYSTGV